jgi:hypothetical protein
MRRKTAKSPITYFVCTKNRRDEFGPDIFHGIGYWHTLKDGDNPGPMYENIEKREEEEVWIPFNNIEYIKSLMYRPR